jgi:anti-sigma B factor antagonist
MSTSDAVDVTSGLSFTVSLSEQSAAADEPGLRAPASGRNLQASSLPSAWQTQENSICRRGEVLRGFGAFDVTVSRIDGENVVTVWGEVDVLTAPHLRRALEAVLRQSGHRLVVDLAHLEFIDGSGLRVLGAALERCRASGGDLAIRSAPAVALKLLRITGLAEALTIEDSASHG